MIEMRYMYMPTSGVLQVFLQNVTCCSRYATFKHEIPRVHIGKPVSYDVYIHVLCFIYCFCLQ